MKRTDVSFVGQNNNWLRMHGYTMVHRKRYRHRSKDPVKYFGK